MRFFLVPLLALSFAPRPVAAKGKDEAPPPPRRVIAVTVPTTFLAVPLVCLKDGKVGVDDACEKWAPRRLQLTNERGTRRVSRVRANACTIEHPFDIPEQPVGRAWRSKPPYGRVQVLASGDVGLVSVPDGTRPFEIDLDGDGKDERITPVDDLWKEGVPMTEPRVDVVNGANGPSEQIVRMNAMERVRVLATTDVDRDGHRELWAISTRRFEGQLHWSIGVTEYHGDIQTWLGCYYL